MVPDKRYQLLAYLAYDGDWVGRERAAFLFWPDSDTASSRRNLRAVLQRLRTLPFEVEVEATKHQLRWAVPTDVGLFEEAISTGDTKAALAAIRGPLLKDLDGGGANEFDEWLAIEREQLRSRWRSLAMSHLSDGRGVDSSEADEVLRRLLTDDPLDEEAVRAYMGAQTRLGRPSAALRAFRELESRLGAELGVSPTSDTMRELAAAQSEAEPHRAAAHEDGPAARRTEAPAPVYEPGSGALPEPATSFVGRSEELAAVLSLLSDPGCRLLSLVGLGGMGKTRLAFAAAWSLANEGSTARRVVFVALDPVSSAGEVLPAIASACGAPSAAGQDPLRQVGEALSALPTLLFVDNFEHVLDAGPVLSKLLEATKDLKVLVTSRERLGLGAEWVFEVDGLDHPGEELTIGNLEEHGATLLLIERARKVRPGFAVREPDLPALRKLMALTQGMPLAIELAASWLRAVPLTTLVDDLEADIASLESTTVDLPPRQGSIRTVFERSWDRLSDAERSAFRSLSVFVGPFTPEAAAFVAGAGRATLAGLVDRSLLRLGPGGRYERHPLLRAFAREKAVANAEGLRDADAKHTAYYLRFLRERTDRARGPQMAAVGAEIDAEFTEIRAALRRAGERNHGVEIVAFMRLLELELGYFLARGHDEETLKLLDLASDQALKLGDLDTARDLRGRVGDVFAINRGDPARALPEYVTAADIAGRCVERSREAVFISLQGVMAKAMDPDGDWGTLDRALALAKGSGDPLALSTVLEHRGYAHTLTGDMEGARQNYEASLRAIEDLADPVEVHPFDLARRRYYATVNLGDFQRRAGDTDGAVATRLVALDIARGVGNELWEAHARLELAEMYADASCHDDATLHLRAAWELYRANHVTAQRERIARIAERHSYAMPE